PGGNANGVTPPTCIPVNAIISSAEANDAFETLINLVTRLFTSRRVCASTTHATNFFGSFFDATMMVLQDRSTGYPYFSQNAAVSANAGSIRINSYGTPSFATADATSSSGDCMSRYSRHTTPGLAFRR